MQCTLQTQETFSKIPPIPLSRIVSKMKSNEGTKKNEHFKIRSHVEPWHLLLNLHTPLPQQRVTHTHSTTRQTLLQLNRPISTHTLKQPHTHIDKWLAYNHGCDQNNERIYDSKSDSSTQTDVLRRNEKCFVYFFTDTMIRSLS